MLKQLQVKLEASFRKPEKADEADKARYQKAISRALWGIYCFERYWGPLAAATHVLS
jgi:hypothetical protein